MVMGALSVNSAKLFVIDTLPIQSLTTSTAGSRQEFNDYVGTYIAAQARVPTCFLLSYHTSQWFGNQI